MKKQTNEMNRAFSKEEVQMVKNKQTNKKKTNEGHKGNSNQSHIKILLYSC
jgi:hypothetical protein